MNRGHDWVPRYQTSPPAGRVSLCESQLRGTRWKSISQHSLTTHTFPRQLAFHHLFLDTRPELWIALPLQLHQMGIPATQTRRSNLPSLPKHHRQGPIQPQQVLHKLLKPTQIDHRVHYIPRFLPSQPSLIQMSPPSMSKPKWHSRLSRVIRMQDPNSSETCLKNVFLCSQL